MTDPSPTDRFQGCLLGAMLGDVVGAVFIGGDTDTIACMAGAVSGAFLGRAGIPARWLEKVREDEYGVETVARLADRLLQTYRRPP